MSVRDYTGTERVISSRFEGQPGHRVVEWDDEDDSIYRGYELPDGRLVGACVQVSPTRQATLDAANAATTAAAAQVTTFRQSIVALAAQVHAGTSTAAQQRQLIVKLARAVLGLMSDA